MEIWPFQVIYLLSLTSRGAGRDVAGEGEAEVGSSGVTSGGGDGRGLRGPSEPLPITAVSGTGQMCPSNKRSIAFGANHCSLGHSLEAFIILG